MSKLNRYLCANIPDMSPSQARAVISLLDSIAESIWKEYGDVISSEQSETVSPSDELSDFDLDAIF
jgi:hypothetical protein